LNGSNAPRGPIGRWYDRWQIRRLHHAYVKVSGLTLGQRGYDGFVADLELGLEKLSPEVRERADDAVLNTVLGGRWAVALIDFLASILPKPTARLFTALTPAAFSFLIGDCERTGTYQLHLPHCKFVRTGGRPLCLEVCRAPTQAFFDRMGIPLEMEPNLESFQCHWHYGGERTR
jgi:hypothetical protein